jgi:hypothetical protein
MQIGTIIDLNFGKKATLVKGEIYNPNVEYKVPVLDWQLPYFKQGDKVYVNTQTGHVVLVEPPYYMKSKPKII